MGGLPHLLTRKGNMMPQTRPPQRVNVGPMHAARKANVKLRKAWEAQALLEALGCTVTWPTVAHPDIAAATIKR